ncbi:hypothetical protein [Halobacillus seohaensis]|uniref:Uncharacterized protein n=1 Tax=Halobacillus seohaensis TaxID=447421 RepID=A0ABW2EQR3_9BACI
MHELATLAQHHSFFTDYVRLIHKHNRLLPLDVSELKASTHEIIDELKQSGASEVKTYAGIFVGMIVCIEQNNELAQGDVTPWQVNQRVQRSFRILRLVNRSYEIAASENYTKGETK